MPWQGTRGGTQGDWRKTRRRILKRDPICQLANLDICTRISTEVDHRTPLARGGTDQDTNLAGVCHACHQRKTQVEAAAGRALTRKPRRRTPESNPGLRT